MIATKEKPMPLTKKQARVLKFFIEEIKSGRGAPTIREIGKKFGLSSTVSGRDVQRALVKKGWLIKEEGRSRGHILNPRYFEIHLEQKHEIELRPPRKNRRR